MPVRVLLGYDGSPAAGAAIEAAALLFPHGQARIAHLWTPMYADDSLRHRLWTGRGHVDEFVAAIEYEGEREARQIAAMGVTLARAAGWEAEPLVARSLGGDGVHLAELAETPAADLIVVGARGLAGARAVLGSVSDMVVHYATRPVLVVPYPLLEAEHAALAAGPVVVGFDGSTGSGHALRIAHELLPGRELLRATVDDGEVPAQAPAPPIPEELVTRLHLRRHGSSARDTAAALASCASSADAALVVVGSRGRSAVREILLGSVAVATLHHAHRPVLVVPALADGDGTDADADADATR
ncbi:universal stress protein [Actinocatenispora thailandica]|uniref:Universal stress protein n=1 Tax=Actinocatenispora thailandica TaxID=227318 RepID=A0A7R7DLY3_9ACTN|nr:universal stress protein [Actinocatenispora thailandica]BCJ34048.1 universal stress protein [Actinocatenispora thailandica]